MGIPISNIFNQNRNRFTKKKPRAIERFVDELDQKCTYRKNKPQGRVNRWINKFNKHYDEIMTLEEKAAIGTYGGLCVAGGVTMRAMADILSTSCTDPLVYLAVLGIDAGLVLGGRIAGKRSEGVIPTTY